jgi:hypothetical protein
MNKLGIVPLPLCEIWPMIEAHDPVQGLDFMAHIRQELAFRAIKLPREILPARASLDAVSMC